MALVILAVSKPLVALIHKATAGVQNSSRIHVAGEIGSRLLQGPGGSRLQIADGGTDRWVSSLPTAANPLSARPVHGLQQVLRMTEGNVAGQC